MLRGPRLPMPDWALTTILVAIVLILGLVTALAWP